MAYTPYSQALPDTSRYTLDPVLQERLYQPVRTDPYQSGMLSSWANDYYADPFGYTNKRFGKLDEVLPTDAPEVGLGGMFAPQASSGGVDSASQENQSNYYQDLEDRYTELNISEDGMSPKDARAAAQASVFKEQSARNARLGAAMTLFGNAVIPGATAFGLANYGPTGYMDHLQGNTRVMMGDTTGYTGQDSNLPSRQSGQDAPVVTGAQVQAALNEAKARNNYNSRFSPTDSGGGGGGYSGPSTAAEAGYSGDFM